MALQKMNFTAVPNAVLDDMMPNMNGAEIKVLLFICRKTIGWHKDSDAVSYSQLAEGTGLKRSTVASAVRKLEKEYCVIQVDRSKNRTSRYTLWFENQTTCGSKIELDGAESGSKIEHTKESNINKSKETIQPPAVPAKPDQSKADDYKEKSAALLDTWKPLFFAEMQREYLQLPADWKQIKNSKIFEIFTPDQIRDLVNAWFNEPEKFHTRTIRSFASGYVRVEKKAFQKKTEGGTW